MSKGFTGFKTVKFPIYTVVCPQSGHTFDVRCMNVSEVNRIRESLLTKNKLTEFTNRCVFECLETKPDHIKTFNDFIEKTTVKDRDAIVYGLYVSTFGEERSYLLECSNCSNQEYVKVNYNKSFSFNAFPTSESVVSSYNIKKATDPSKTDEEMETIIESNKRKKEHPAIKALKGGMPEDLVRQEFPDFFEDKENIASIKEEVGSIKIGSDNNSQNIENEDNIIVKDEDKIKFVEDETEESKEEKKTTKATAKEEKEEIIDNVFTKKIEVKLQDCDVIAIVQQPRLVEEDELLKHKSLLNQEEIDISADSLIIEKFIEYEEGKVSPVQIVDDREDIIKAYKSLSIRDSKKIKDVYIENFGQYCIEIKSKWTCNRCNEENVVNVDIINEFFRAISRAG